jgi:hypothetical protein
METNMTDGVEQLNTEPQVPEQTPAQNEPPEIDYKAEFEKAQEKLKKAEYTLYRKNKEEKQKEEAPAIDVENEVNAAVEKRMSQIASDFTADTIESALSSVAGSEDERKLIKFHYDNSIQRTGFSKVQIIEDMEKAKLLANAPKYLKQTKEMSEALKSKRTTSTTSMGTNVDTGMVSPKVDNLQSKFSARDWDFMKSRGWTDEQIRKAGNPTDAFEEKPLPKKATKL